MNIEHLHQFCHQEGVGETARTRNVAYAASATAGDSLQPLVARGLVSPAPAAPHFLTYIKTRGAAHAPTCCRAPAAKLARDVVAPSMDYHCRASTLAMPSTRPLRAEPAQSSSAVACGKNRYFCRRFSSLFFLVGFPHRRVNADVGEVRIYVRLNQKSAELSRTSTHILGLALLPCSPLHR